MKKNKTKLVDFREEAPFLLVAALVFILVSQVGEFGDDASRRIIYSDMSLVEVLRYSLKSSLNVSMRIVSYFIVDILIWLKNGILIWRVLNSVMIFILLKSTSYVFIDNKKYNVFLSFLFCLCPYYDELTAGLISTSVTYLWGITMMMVCIAWTKWCYYKETVKILDVIVLFLLAFVASNQEQMLVVLLIFYFGLFLFGIYKKEKKVKWIVIPFISICINIKLLFFMDAISNRYEMEQHWFPDYAKQSFINKMEMSVSSTLQRALYTRMLVLILALMLTIIIWKMHRDKVRWTYIPLIGTIICAIAYFPSSGLLGKLVVLLNTKDGRYGRVDALNSYKFSPYLSIALQLITLFSILISVGIISSTYLEFIILESILLTGLLTRVAMGLSPTVWASGERTYNVLWYMIVVEIICILNKKKEIIISDSRAFCEKNEKYIIDILYFFTIIAFICNSCDVLTFRGIY